jgi:hypothetical protein
VRVKKRFYPLLLVGPVLFSLFFSGCAGLPRGELPETLKVPPGTVERLSWTRIAPGLEYAVLDSPGLLSGTADLSGPKPMPRVHFLKVEPGHPEIRIQALKPVSRGMSAERAFELSGADVLINATPFRYTFGLDGLRMQPVGAYVVDGVSYGRARKDWGVLWRDDEGELRLTVGLPEGARVDWAVGGYKKIIEGGKNIGIHGERHARTALGLTAGAAEDTAEGAAGDVNREIEGDGKGARSEPLLYILVVEGETRERPGLTSREVALLMEPLGVREAFNLDGGDSSLLWIRGKEVYRGGRRRMACYLGFSSYGG